MTPRPLAAGRRVAARTPLQVKLILAVLALVTVALVLIGTASAAALEGYLVGRLDGQLALVADRYRHEDDGFGPGPGREAGHGTACAGAQPGCGRSPLPGRTAW